MRGKGVALGVLSAMLVFTAPAWGASKNVQLLDNLPEAKDATAINFLQYDGKRKKGHGKAWSSHKRRSLDVMLVTGRFGLKSYSLRDPRHPGLLDEITAEELRLPGDPEVNTDPAAGPISTFWQNEDMDVDRKRKLALLSRDPRAYAGSTTREPGEADPNGATNIAGVYIVDAKNPWRLKLLSFEQLPTGHTTTCINGCKWLWTGGPAATTTQQGPPRNWTFGRPIIVTDLGNPSDPQGYPMDPVDLFRRDGVTAYSHDVQVDNMGIAWVSGDGGTRGYWTRGKHWDPLGERWRRATPLDPIPYAGGGLPASVTGDETGGFEHNAWRPVGKNAPRGDKRYRKGELLLATEEDFGPAEEACANRGQFSIASLAGSFGGEAWRSTAADPFRLEVVGTWNPANKEGSRPVGGPYDPNANFCSAHYFDVDGPIVTYAWYGEGTRFLDISNPANPRQFAYWRPDDTIVWASYLHKGYIYTADRNRGVDVLRFRAGASSARASGREVVAPAASARHRRFLKRMSSQFVSDAGTAGICFLRTSY
ncbi:MAG TPA: hypothetical protein VHJ39_12775 [Solirubrobacteraceae bacterium]|nr:hypothetical protein [Solirubrobacteraceae bacterium]